MAVDLKKWSKAVQVGDEATIKKCIADGVDVTQPIKGIYPVDYKQPSPLALLASNGNPKFVGLILEAAKTFYSSGSDDAQNDLADSLTTACNYKNLKTVQALVEFGADVNYCWGKEDRRDCVLCETIGEAGGKKGMEVFRYLLDQGANPSKSKNGRSMLECAAACASDGGVVAELISRGADPNKSYADNWLPLLIAIDSEDKVIIKAFLEAGADPNLRCPNLKKNAFEYAKEMGKGIVSLVEKYRSSKSRGNAGAKTSTTQKLSSLKAVFAQLEDAAKNAGRLNSFTEGASTGEISSLQKSTQITLNKELKDYFAWHDGQNDYESMFDGEWEGFCLLNTEESATKWNVWNELLEFGEFEEMNVSNEDAIREDWWNAKWLPIAGNGGGDFLCADFAPTKAGKKGQIIVVWHDNSRRDVAYGSIRAMLADLADQLSGKS